MSELLPCPFCGDEAELTGFNAPEYWVWCPNCKASADAHTGMANAIAAWNSRAERTCRIEWRDDSYDTDAGYERDSAYFCTACRADFPYPLQECWDDYQAGNYEKPFNYCPNCGAKVVVE